MKPDLSIVVVTYESARLLDGCLQSLHADPMIERCEVLLADNASTDGAPQRAEAEWPGVRLVQMGRNAGFGAANNAAIARCSADAILMANPDTRLAEGGLEGLLRYLQRNPGIGLVGPKLLNADGSVQESIRNFPCISHEAFECVFLHRAFPGLTTRFADVVQWPGEYESARETDWVSGAVMLGRAEALRDVGGFDEGFFLYYEETDLCYRLQDAGWGVTYVPGTAFFHIGGEYDSNAALALENQRSKLRYFLKHQGRARMLLASAITVARLTLRSALWSMRVLTAPDRGWQGRLTAGVRTLAHYPGLVARFLFAPVPATVGTSHEASS